MKVKYILSVLAVSFLALTSCKKDYNCVCGAGGVNFDSETYYDVKKSDAESRCSDYENEAQQYNSSITCSINEID